ncbi:hypothetical protein [Azospirillum sp.]|uniref:hypothetical protein n=1 Tax=Azospirillum sp. TaxID=34012 RepID=UPI003D71D453
MSKPRACQENPFLWENWSPPLSTFRLDGERRTNAPVDWTPPLLDELRRVSDLGWGAQRIARHMGVCTNSLARGLLALNAQRSKP